MAKATKYLVMLGIAFIALLAAKACQKSHDAPVLTRLANSGDSLVRSLRLTGELFRVDTLRLTKLVVQSETTLVQLIDTAHFYHTDTVKITVEKLVQIDSTIHACMVTVSDCERGWATQKALTANRDSTIQILKREMRFSRCGVTLGYGAVLNSGKVLGGASVLAGCRVWP